MTHCKGYRGLFQKQTYHIMACIQICNLAVYISILASNSIFKNKTNFKLPASNSIFKNKTSNYYWYLQCPLQVISTKCQNFMKVLHTSILSKSHKLTIKKKVHLRGQVTICRWGRHFCGQVFDPNIMACAHHNICAKSLIQ